MIKYLPLLIPISLLVLLDYTNCSLLGSSEYTTNLIPVYWCLSILGFISLAFGVLGLKRPPIQRSAMTNVAIGVASAIIVNKIILFLFYIINSLIGMMGLTDHSSYLPAVLFVISLMPLVAMIYGTIWGKYNFKKEDIQLKFKELPEAFDGFKIVQISDIHSGTWDSIGGVRKGIELIKEQNADMIVFTGDLVNTDKDEIDPFMHLFKELEAPYGKYAILGNHDYYGQPRDSSLRKAYYDHFFSKYEEMGFDLILNDSRLIHKGQESFNLIGVENWGSGRFFPKRGDLDMATRNCADNGFSILLSHDPSHWDLKAISFPFHFHLTLSGHTHGMQFGINLPFFKWSPVQYRYKRWMGLYEEGNQYLYVNRGFGVLGYPGRVGMSPEVTVIELTR